MKKGFWTIIMLVIIVIAIVVYSMGENSAEDNITEDSDQLLALEVEFDVPKTADVNETVELIATVSFGDEVVTDADEVQFEIWQQGNEEESIKIDATNNGDGTYSAETTFEKDGVYEMYAHTTARDLHTMPKKTVTVGTGTVDEELGEDHDHDSEENAHSHHEEGFNLHFVEPENLNTDSETELMVHLQLDGNPLEEAYVRYEIWNDSVSDKHAWIDAEETTSGEYKTLHLFAEPGTYHVMVHVENDNGLHEHEEYELVVEE